jgi:hypothetical protein
VVSGPYWRLRRSYWEDGKTKKENIAHIGAAPSRLAAYELARQKRLLCGVHKCFQAPTHAIDVYALCDSHARRFREGEPLRLVAAYTTESAKC